MKDVINLFKKHKITINNFVSTVISSLPRDYIDNADSILKYNPYIQLMYSVDDKFKQTSPIICKNERNTDSVGSDKYHYFAKLDLDDNGIYISNPYIHYRTGKASISVVKFIDSVYYVFDIKLIELLEELRLIEYNSIHDKFKKIIYAFGSTLLALVSIVLIGYGGFTLVSLLIPSGEVDFLNDIFKSIISITLGLAIYDLAKQIFEHEVIFHSFHHEEDKQYKVLGKFLISIIIALSIETLMVVFKIALEDYTHMLSAFYLMIGTTIMLVGLAYFYKTINKASNREKDD